MTQFIPIAFAIIATVASIVAFLAYLRAQDYEVLWAEKSKEYDKVLQTALTLDNQVKFAQNMAELAVEDLRTFMAKPVVAHMNDENIRLLAKLVAKELSGGDKHSMN